MSPTPPPYTRVEARDVVRRAVVEGAITYAKPHAIDRMRKHGLTMVDVENVLRAGAVGEPEWENGAWRYHVRTNRIEVIVEFWPGGRIFVPTVWRITR